MPSYARDYKEVSNFVIGYIYTHLCNNGGRESFKFILSVIRTRNYGKRKESNDTSISFPILFQTLKFTFLPPVTARIINVS